MNTEETLLKLIDVCTATLDELKNENCNNAFVEGEMTAYVDCLEIIQSWNKSRLFGLNYNVAKKYL